MSHESTDSQRASRKDEHLELAVHLHRQDRVNAFDDVSFIHHSLPGVSAEQVDIGTTVLGSRWEVPFYINAMTGGTQATAAINPKIKRCLHRIPMRKKYMNVPSVGRRLRSI